MLRKTLLLSTLLAFSANAFAGEHVIWKASGELISILIESEIKEIDLSGFHSIEDVDFENSFCAARVYRPDANEQADTCNDNFLQCEIINKDGTRGVLSLQLTDADFTILSWGSPYNTSKIFQTQNDKGSNRLFEALKKSYTRKPRIAKINREIFTDSNGRVLEEYSLDVCDSMYSPAFVTCDRQYDPVGNDQYEIFKTRCLFLFPEKIDSEAKYQCK